MERGEVTMTSITVVVCVSLLVATIISQIWSCGTVYLKVGATLTLISLIILLVLDLFPKGEKGEE